MVLGIRREDKSRWEARVPLVPEDVRRLCADEGVRIRVQSSATRAFGDDAYRAAGAEVVEDLGDCPVVLGVKEIPPERFQPRRSYVYFSHTIKGQPANMPALKRLMELGCNLIDYERIVDEQDRRLVFFGRFAGLAGMIDTLWALGQRLQGEGIESPFARVRPAHRYDDLRHAEREIRSVGEAVRRGGLPEAIRPFMCGFAGYGQVSQGAQQVFDWLGVEEVAPSELASVGPSADACYKVVFKEEHLVTRIDSSRPFHLQEYYDQPDRYRASFFEHARHLTVLMNCIYWTPKYPKLLTREQLRALYGGARPPRLRVIGDITCDIDGSLECTVRSTTPDSPIYVYDPVEGTTSDGVAGHGPVVLAVDFLPCELPVDASRFFSESLRGLIPGLAAAAMTSPLGDSGLPPELQRATIVYHGALTEPYEYLGEFVR